MIESFLQYLRYEKSYSSYTVLSYKRDLLLLESYCETRFGGFEPSKLTSQQFRLWIIDMMDNKQKPSTVKRKISTVRSFYRFLNRKGLTDNNPTQKIAPIKQPKQLPKFFSEKDMQKSLEVSENSCTFEDVRDGLIVEMIYQTGLRRSEISSLKDAAVDVVQKELKVLGKGNKERMIPFGADLAEKINYYREVRRVAVESGEIERVESDKFFLTTKGQEVKPAKVYTIVTKIMGAVSTQSKRSPHVLRHTFATAMLNNGADINAIKELLGHESLAATQIYTHATFEEIKQNYQQAHPRAKKERRSL